MLKYITFFIILFSNLALSQTEINLRAKLDEERYKQWDEYIRKYAPADSAFNVAFEIARRHFMLQRSGVAMYALELYKPLFPDKDSIFELNISQQEELMLTQTPNPDMIALYAKYAKQKAPDHNGLIAVKRIADSYINRRDWDSAVYVFNIFKPLFPEHKDHIDKIINILQSPEEGLIVRNLGSNINTRLAEWDPNPTPDGKYLYFSASNRRGGHGSTDIWFSEMKNGAWQKAENLGTAINGDNDETIDNVTADGTGLLLSGTFRGTYGQFDIFFAQKSEDGWESMTHYPMPINTEYVDESGNITSDGNALIFTSDRPGGIGEHRIFGKYSAGSMMGNMDIYVSMKQGNSWSEPINLGKTINTPYAERSAFLHPDGKTLYFSSDGHPGLGRLDVFKSERLSDTSWTEWSEPVNLGKEINGADDDWGYKVSVSGDSAFFAARNRQEGFGDWDLYSVTLPDNAKPQKVLTIRGRVLDTKGRHIPAEIVWEDLETGKEIGKLRSDPRDGSYFIALPYGKNYGYYASRNGFYPESNSIDLRNIKDTSDIYHNITLVSLNELRDENKKITVNNLFFDFGEHSLKPQSFLELKRLVKFLENNKKYKVIIEGHTDNIGTKEFNKQLSLKRAESVANYLEKHGFNKEMLEIKGYGYSKPFKSNSSDKNRAKNRRVEISFKKK